MTCAVKGCSEAPHPKLRYCEVHLHVLHLNMQAINADPCTTFTVYGNFDEGAFIVRMPKRGARWALVRKHINALVRSLPVAEKVYWNLTGEEASADGKRLWDVRRFRRFDWDPAKQCLVEVPHGSAEG